MDQHFSAQSLGQGASLRLERASTASPNDYLRCEISATDANGDTSSATAVVQVINRAPEVSVMVSPGLTVLEGDLVSCSGTVNDPDNDTISSQSISWTNQTTGLVVSLQEDYLVDEPQMSDPILNAFEATDAHGETATASAVVAVSFGNVYTIDGTSETWTEGVYDYDGLTLINGATLNIEGNVILNILGVLSVDATSLINGDGWSCPNPVPGTGNGPCPGEWVSVEAASGGGYGGLGGEGGTDSASSIAIGGCTTGSSDSFAIEKGASGGSSDNNPGGAGGASIHVNAAEIVIDGEISTNGDDGECCSGRNGGGGAGGGILLSAGVIEISGVLSANGGFGGDGATSSADGGGGGGGGRIASSRRNRSLYRGLYRGRRFGWIYGGYQPGQDGEAGTYYQN